MSISRVKNTHATRTRLQCYLQDSPAGWPAASRFYAARWQGGPGQTPGQSCTTVGTFL